jgi:lysophospholipase L1-like esterase
MTCNKLKATAGNLSIATAAMLAASGVFLLLDMLLFAFASVIEREATNRSVRIAVREYHHGFGKNKRTVERWGDESYELITNSLGMRDSHNREVAITTPNRRIVFIGDSFTEATGVRWEDSFVGRIERALSPEKIEVLNAATASYSAVFYRRKLQHLIEDKGLKVDRVIVMLDMSDVYDSTHYALDSSGNVIRTSALKRAQAFIEQNTVVLRRIVQFLHAQYLDSQRRARAKTETANAGDSADLGLNRKSLWTIRQDVFEAHGREGLANEARHLKELASFLRSRGIAMTLAVYPWPDNIWHNDLHCKQVTYWTAWARENGVEFVNLFPVFLQQNPQRPAQTIRQHYIKGDVHWNAAGHEVVARALLAHLGN